MIRTYKRKLKLTKAQERRIVNWIGVCRMVHNMAMEIKETAYKGKGESIHKYALTAQLKDIRADYDWVRDVPAQSLLAAVERMDNAYQNFFKGRGFPKFASKKRYKSISFKSVLKVKGNSIKLMKIGYLRMFKDAPILGIPKIAHIKIEPTGFFVYIVCDNVPKKFNSENQTVGLDLGVRNFCADSNGIITANPLYFIHYERKLRVAQRSLSRKRQGSNSWKKQAKRVGLIHHKIGNQRKDFLQKLSTEIAKANSTVCIEDLKVANLAKSGRISKHIQDCGWWMFRQMLEYKTNVVVVRPNFTSQTCFDCGHVAKENRQRLSEFKCVKCGHEDHADINAAKNIKSKGIALIRERSPLGQALGEELHIRNVSDLGARCFNSGECA